MPPTAKQAANKPKSTLKHKSSKNSHNIINTTTNNHHPHPNNNKHNSKQSSISKANSNHHHQQTSKRKTKTKQLAKKAKCKQPPQAQQAQQQSSINNHKTSTNNNNNQKVSIQVPRLSSTSVGFANTPTSSSRSSHSSPIDNLIHSPIDIPFNNHNNNNNNNVNINNIHNNYINNNNQNNNQLLNGTSVEVFKSCLEEEDDSGNSVSPQQSTESTRISLCWKTAMPTEIEEEQFFESESPSQVEPIPALTPLCCTGRPHCVSPADILTHSKSRSNSKPIYRYRMTLTPESDNSPTGGTTANCIIPTTFDNQVSTSSSASQSGSVSTSSLQSSSQSAQPKFVPSNITAADSSFLFRTAIYPPELLKYSLLKAANMSTDSKFNWNSPRQLATSNSNEKLNTTANNNKFRYAMPQVFRQPQPQVPPKPPPITQPPKSPSPDDYLDTDERSISNSQRNGR